MDLWVSSKEVGDVKWSFQLGIVQGVFRYESDLPTIDAMFDKAHLIFKKILLDNVDALEANEKLIKVENVADIVAAQQAGYEKSLISRLTLNPRKARYHEIKLLILYYCMTTVKFCSTPSTSVYFHVFFVALYIATINLYDIRLDYIARMEMSEVASLAVRSGNGILLKGGKEATRSNVILRKVINGAIPSIVGEKLIGLVTSRDEILDFLKEILLLYEHLLKNGALNDFIVELRSQDDVVGKVYTMAKDQIGCRFLQKKFTEGDPKDIEKIFGEIISYIVELMNDPFRNYLVQKLLEVCNEDQRMCILSLLVHLGSYDINGSYRYVEDDDGNKKYFAAFHLNDSFMLVVIIDDFVDFFSES
ncbi:hypothetical protein J5N97_001786 [Dioscorea zingiberensis]|uniref:PUM-HD domain-containing protein n=1 Tax=Dioscorea zingiberensis TaxID=325984 RepID=A0A9D5BT99_9LILI|nr:hypothetical protein J5N97_001786 [Dioscorea zingiberensis]